MCLESIISKYMKPTSFEDFVMEVVMPKPPPGFTGKPNEKMMNQLQVSIPTANDLSSQSSHLKEPSPHLRLRRHRNPSADDAERHSLNIDHQQIQAFPNVHSVPLHHQTRSLREVSPTDVAPVSIKAVVASRSPLLTEVLGKQKPDEDVYPTAHPGTPPSTRSRTLTRPPSAANLSIVPSRPPLELPKAAFIAVPTSSIPTNSKNTTETHASRSGIFGRLSFKHRRHVSGGGSGGSNGGIRKSGAQNSNR
ncbi:hypothetical protein AAHC03_01161 [Spirometra sp. Aus1]